MASTALSKGGTAHGLSLPPLIEGRAARANLGDRIFRAVLRLAGGAVLLIVLGIFVEMVRTAWPAMHKFGPRFLVNSVWDPVAEHFGALPFVYGTLLSSLLAMLIAVPLGIGAAVFLAELAPQWLRPPVSFLVELVAAVPSVVYGLWGIF